MRSRRVLSSQPYHWLLDIRHRLYGEFTDVQIANATKDFLKYKNNLNPFY